MTYWLVFTTGVLTSGSSNPGATRSDKDGYLDEVFISFEHKHKLNEKVGGE
jgi:hypothetical protein